MTPLPQSKLRARRRRRRVWAAALWVVLLVAALGGIVGLAHLPHLRITAVETTGVEGTEVTLVKQHIHSYLQGYYLYVLPHDHALLYPRQNIISNLLKTFPTFSSVDIRAEGLRGLRVSVEKREPDALWCGALRSAPEPCIVLDQRGIAYESALKPDNFVYTTYYGALGAGSLPRQYLSEAKFHALSALVETFESEQDMRIAWVEVDQAGDVRLHFANGFELIFALADGGGDIYERFALALTASPFKNRSTAEFEYLDLRFGDRLYYRLKEEKESAPEEDAQVESQAD